MGRLRIPLGITALVGALAMALAGGGCGGDASPSTAEVPESPAAISGAPRHIIYLSEFKIRTVLERLLPNGPGPLERVQTFRQLPAAQTILPAPNRIARVDGTVIATLPPHEIARRLRRAINGTCTTALPCRSHLVAIDDIGDEFVGRGGARLKAAMDELNTPSPWGSTYAKRVVMYLAYPMMASLASSAGSTRWDDAIRAVAAGESYWLEMYKSVGKGQIGDVTYREWRRLPLATMRALVAKGGQLHRGHFMMGPGSGLVTGMPVSMCPIRIGCAWVASESTPLNHQLARHGTGVYRFGPRQLVGLCVQTFAMHEADDKMSHNVIKHLCREWTLTRPAGSTRAQG